MALCWEMRGCDAEMQSRCPHGVKGALCPSDCNFAACVRPVHEVAQGLAILDNPEVDRGAAVKEARRACMFFIEHGPLLSERM